MEETTTKTGASITARISREIVQLLKQTTGRGPVRARTHLLDDCVVILLREGHTTSEETHYQGGGSRSVAQGRVDLSEGVRAQFIAAVERLTSRKVIGFMTSSQQHPDLISQIYVFEGAPARVDAATEDGQSGEFPDEPEA